MSLTSLSIGVGLFLGLLGAVVAGRAWARRTPASSDAQFGVVQGATLALLGLVLGFSFSSATGRFSQRQDIIVEEANAIGTAWLRSDLLSAEAREAYRRDLRAYLDARLELSRAMSTGSIDGAVGAVRARQAALWSTALAGIEERPAAMMATLGPLNELIDLQTRAEASSFRHTPLLIVGVVWACAVTALVCVGLGLTSQDRRAMLAAVILSILIAAVIWITIDLDYPRRGLIRVSDRAFLELRASMGPG